MKLKQNNGYTLIEIGVALIIIAVFVGLSATLFNGAYNNYRMIEQRNAALSYAINEIEYILITDLETLGVVLEENEIIEDAESKEINELSEGYYGVPDDKIDTQTAKMNNMIINTKIRRLPIEEIDSDGTINLADATTLRVTVTVEYKYSPKDTNYSNITLEAIKVSDLSEVGG